MNSRNVCGNFGTCVSSFKVNNGVNLTYNRCECSNFTGGYFCEHHPYHPYSRDMYNGFIVNPLSYVKYNRDDLEHLKFWEAGVAAMDQEEDEDKITQYNDDREL